MTKAIFVTAMMLFFAGNMFAQSGSVGINNDGSSPNSKAMLDVSSTTKGFLPPRMTYAEKILITSPPAGLMVWCSNCGPLGELQIYNGTIWTSLTAGTASGLPGAPTIGTATGGNALASVPFTAPGNNGGSTITSYTATSTPGSFTGTLTQSGSGTITVTGLTNGTPYTFTVNATNATGTGAASAASNSVTPVALVFAIGQSYGGGIVFYIDGTGQHGLIAATSDQSTGALWGCTTTPITGADGIAIGTGNQNTIDIMNGCGSAGIAAKLCWDLVLNGYSDWFLPSQDELNQMYLQKTAIGGFSSGYYWSSYESSVAEYAWAQSFNNGFKWYNWKGDPYYVRAVRAF